MKKRCTLSIVFTFFTLLILQAQVITMTTYSETDQWSPFRIIKTGGVLTWTASNSILGTIIKNENQPIFDFSGNDGSDILITISSPDGFDGLTIFDLRDRFNGVSVNGIPSQMLVKELDISAATNLIELSTQYNRLPSLDITSLTKLQRLNVRGSRQLANGLDISNNILLTQIIADVTALNQIDISNNSQIVDLRLYDAYYTSNVLDQLLVDLDNHGLFNGSLRIADQNANETITSASYVAYNNLIARGWTIDVAAPIAPAGPEINVTGLGVSIPGNGSNVPSTADGTDFGSVASGGTVVKTFTIENLGDADLNLTGTPLVAISGANASDFSISTQPVSPVTPAGIAIFSVTYTAGSLGVRSAILTIDSNDADEPSYTFNIQAEATGIAGSDIVVLGNGNIITNNDFTPSVTDGTDFGQVVQNTPKINTYTIRNNGIDQLNIASIAVNTFGFPPVYSLSGTSQPLPAIIPSGESMTFSVQYLPTTLATTNGLVQITSSDVDKNPYQFAVVGQGVDAPDIQDLMITQYYSGPNALNKWIEVKNISGNPIVANTYYLALFDQTIAKVGEISAKAPTAFEPIPAMAVDEVLLFRSNQGLPTLPTSSNIGPATQIPTAVCNFDGDDVILISTTNDNTSYNNRVDIIGVVSKSAADPPKWGERSAFIKGGCATELPHLIFDINDWIRVPDINQVVNADSETNLALGTQVLGPTNFNGVIWDNKDPDLSRTAIITNSFTAAPATIETCNLIINSNVVVEFDQNTTNSIVLYGDLTVNGQLIIGDTESLVTIDSNANLGFITKRENSNTLLNLHDNTYWSSPVTSAQLGTVFAGVNPNRIFQYEQTNTDISDISNPVYYSVWELANGAMTPGRGYAVEGPGGSNFPVDGSDKYLTPFSHQIEFTGVPNNGTVSIQVDTNDDSDVDNDFNLIGNPYPTAINLTTFFPLNTNISDVYLWNHGTQISGGVNGSYTQANYVTINNAGSNDGVTKNIGSGQGFMVRALTNGSAVFNNSMKMRDANNQFYKGEVGKTGSTVKVDAEGRDRIWLKLSYGNSIEENILIAFLEESTDGFEWGYDSFGINFGKKLKFYSQIDNKKLVIQALGTFDGGKSVPIGFDSSIEGRFNIGITRIEGNLTNKDIYLVDNLTGNIHDLGQSDYDFNQTETGNFPHRFTLQFSKNALAVEDIINSSDFVLSNSGNGFRINASKIVKEVKVYDVLGRNIEVSRPNLQIFYLDVPQAQTGAVLIFEVKLENGSVLNKKAIKL